jgi:protein phosphatase
MVHGGVTPNVKTAKDIAEAKMGTHSQSLLEDLLWSDPDDTVTGVEPSPRGAGKLFGEDVTDQTLNKLNVRMIVRGHESVDQGFKLNHDGKILTLFSRRGPPYFNQRGAYLDVNLQNDFGSAEQLIPFIHTF